MPWQRFQTEGEAKVCNSNKLVVKAQKEKNGAKENLLPVTPAQTCTLLLFVWGFFDKENEKMKSELNTKKVSVKQRGQYRS